ncbi:MAG: helix-turn-helix domain-containing protein [Oscillatoriales cyanobacterium C42_A2020_001]|nr:helix-turn-helix domain-containing protein [Leptolyngbyaceae cyanobacterium C42_A2020_001]
MIVHGTRVTSVSSRFIEISHSIADRISNLLNASVFIIDEKGILITSSEPFGVETSSALRGRAASLENLLRIPIHYKTETGEIVVGPSLNQEPIPSKIAQALVELVIDQTTSNQEKNTDKSNLKNQFINDLLHGCIADEEVALSNARQLGMDLTPPRAVILVDASSYVLSSNDSPFQDLKAEQQRKTRDIIRIIVNFFHLPNDTICADLGQGEVCVLKASDTKNLGLWAQCHNDSKGLSSSWANLAALKRAADALLIRLRDETMTAIDIGIGRYHPGVAGLARSYEDARAALSLGSRFQGHNQVHCLGELGIAAFVGVADETTKVDLAKYLLSPLDHESELFTTLDAFFAENCCPSSTARRLSIHRNTLSYRLDKIFSLTGLEPRKFDDAVQMRLCLLLRSLQTTAEH